MVQTLRQATSSAALAFALLTATGTVSHAQATQAAPVAKHHSKLKGAIIGAAAGHMLGGHAKSGAVAGALWQHHKNKKVAATR